MKESITGSSLLETKKSNIHDKVNKKSFLQYNFLKELENHFVQTMTKQLRLGAGKNLFYRQNFHQIK